jgi:hypothetical protein
MGFQRETASRGSLAMYTSVCLLVTVFSRERCLIPTVSGRLCRRARVHCFPYDAYRALDRRGDYYYEFGDLYIGTIAPRLEIHNSCLLLIP